MSGTFGSVFHFEQFDTVGNYTVLGAEWEVYSGPGNAGFGVRSQAAVNVVADATATSGGNVLRLDSFDSGGEHFHGGVKLLRPRTYMQAELRVRVDDDPDEVTSGVVIFWPVNDPVLFPVANNPEGVWPAGGELDFWESFDNRDTRTPVRSFIHRLNPAATPPYVAGDDEVTANVPHYNTPGDAGSGGIDQSDWHKIVCSWTPDEVYIEIDNGPPRIITNDPASIPTWDMELTLQIDAWSDTPPSATRQMRVDYVLLREWVPDGGLPEGDLTADHFAHHVEIHDVINVLAEDTSQEGRGLAVESIGAPNAVSSKSPSETGLGEVTSVVHDTAGIILIPVGDRTRAAAVAVSAPVTDIEVDDPDGRLGAWVELPVLLTAESSVSIDVTPGNIYGPTPPPTLLAGQRFPVVVVRKSAPAYPYYSGTTTIVSDSDDLQAAVNAAAEGDVIEVYGDHTNDATTLTVPRRMWIKGMAGQTALLPRVRTTAAMEGLWASGFTIQRSTPVDSNSYEGFQSDIGALTRSRLFDLEITGHGLTVGCELNRRWRNDRNVIHNVRVHEIENRGFSLNCDNLRTWGIEAHDLYRTVDQGFFDVDAVNWAGVGQVHSGFWFRDIIEANSISTDNTGTASPPHPDGFQHYRIELADNTTAWLSSATFEDGVIDLRSGGRQSLILESNSSAGAHLITDTTLRRLRLSGTDGQLVNVKGVDGLTVDECELWITEDSATTFRAITFTSGSGGGATTNPNAVLTNNLLYVADGQALYGGTVPGDLVDTGNSIAPTPTPFDLTPWTSPTIQRPTEAEVMAWLSA